MIKREPDHTFVVVANTRFGSKQRFGPTDPRWSIVEQINALHGWPYPFESLELVERPSAVLHCGNIVDNRTPNAVDYYRYYRMRLVYDLIATAGPLDGDGANLPVGRRGIVEHLASFGPFDVVSIAGATQSPLQLDEGAIARASELGRNRRAGAGVILLTYYRPERVGGMDRVVETIGSPCVILCGDDHTPNLLHRDPIYRFGPALCVQVGVCNDDEDEPPYARNFYVVRFRGSRIRALPWHWEYADWDSARGWYQLSDRAVRSLRFEGSLPVSRNGNG